jgi:RTX calcium-binding nonapeptide repeat (4 copies)
LICGGGGHDRLNGGDGNDRLLGQGGNDGLWGEKGTDTLLGAKGNDLLDGGSGSNTGVAGRGTATCLRVNITRTSRCEPTSPVRDFTKIGTADSWDGSDGTFELNGRAYRNSTSADVSGGDVDSVQFNLGRDYRRLVTTVGWEDNNTDSSATALFEIYGDGPDPLSPCLVRPTYPRIHSWCRRSRSPDTDCAPPLSRWALTSARGSVTVAGDLVRRQRRRGGDVEGCDAAAHRDADDEVATLPHQP